MPNGTVEILFWGVQPFRIGKPSAGHVALLITPSEAQDLSTFPQQMLDNLPEPRQLYISFYGGGDIGHRNYRSFRDDINPSARAGGYQPDGRITLYHLDIVAMLDKLRVLISNAPAYSRLASTASFSSYNTGSLARQYNCVSFALELLFAGGIGNDISVWNTMSSQVWGTIKNIGYHLVSWMPDKAGLWLTSTFMVLMLPVLILEGPAFVWHGFYTMGKDILTIFTGMKDVVLGHSALVTIPSMSTNIIILCSLALFAYLLPVSIDAFRKWRITSPVDIYELVSDVAQHRIQHELPQTSPIITNALTFLYRGGIKLITTFINTFVYMLKISMTTISHFPLRSPSISALTHTSQLSEVIPISTASSSSPIIPLLNTESTLNNLQSPISSVLSPSSPRIFRSTGSYAHSSLSETLFNSEDDDNIPLQGASGCMSCGFL